ncbi:filamentous hemagglutinin N-terminal domain-containing protein [Aerosakkonema sp. BLCC-F183]|uniref:two-partner secretion domain-containing protein n=1 Tax=Aerosakkonema sp. BLCC-F183 TaxID=3342834 RepID=UPI0035B9E98C
MTERSQKKKSKIFCILTYIFGFPSLATAQIVPDNTLPVNSTVTFSNNSFTIEGGTELGSNLFHSFEQFSIPTNGTAYFNNTLTIQNIFSRVTGNSISNIDGLIRANGDANLFLINPNGIIFGQNASLNIGGSFLASTANSLLFKDGSQFSATNPQAPPLLTVNVPVGLQFTNTPGAISVQGTGHNFSVDPETGKVTRNDSAIGLSVNPGNTLALIGGDVTLTGGNLTANGGRVELGSVVNGQLSIVDSNGKITIDRAESTNNYGDIQLLGASAIDVSGNGGSVQIQGRNIYLYDGSTILTLTQAEERGENLTVKASDTVELIGTTADSRLFRSSLLSQAQGEGKAADLTIETGQLIIQGGEAAASTFGAGDAGNLIVRARDAVQLTGIETDGELTSGLFSLVNPDATGNGGNLTVETRQLTVKNGAQIATTTFSDGQGGNLTIRASDSVELIGGTITIDPFAELPYPSGLFSLAVGFGQGGNLTVETGRLIVNDAAEISNTTFSDGNAGTLLIRASDSVKVSANGGISTQVNQEEATGNGGNITIETKQLIVQNGGQITASTFGIGAGGTLIVRGVEQEGISTANEAESVELIGISPDGFPSGLFAITGGTGAGGNLIINTRRLIAENGAQAAASTIGEGLGGTVTVNASESVQLRGIGIKPDGEIARTGEGDIIRSGLLARTRFEGNGKAGSININTEQLTIQDGATTTVSTRLGSENAAAGNITAQANNILLENGIITAETRAGDFGNIELNSNNLQLRRQSSITSNATGTGGNITLNTGVLAALENSDITANSTDSRGGQVNINTEGIFRQGFLGTNVSREASDFTSDITATSNLGPQFDGVINIQTPEIDPTQGLIALPPIDNRPVFQNVCAATRDNDEIGEFVLTGRGGLPPNPREALNLSTAESTFAPTEIIEAQGWIKDDKGVIHLIVQAPKVTPYSPAESVTACRTPSPVSMNTFN